MNCRATLGMIGLLAMVSCLSQQSTAELPKLEPAQAVDLRIKSVDWHPHAKALFYTREEDNGLGLGFYVPGDKEGKVVLRTEKGDTFETRWFAGRTSALVWITHPLPNERQLIRFYLVDAETKKVVDLYEEEASIKSKLQFDADASPLLAHAIVTRTDVTGTKHLVLPEASTKLLSSADLDKASKEGYSGPTWSVDGTAVYGNQGPGLSLNSNRLSFIVDGDAATQATSGESDKSINVVISGLSLSGGNSAGGLTLRFLPPPPPTGATVLELMPTNAFLRSVKFKGQWKDTRIQDRFEPQSKLSRLDFGVSRGYANSWWLTLPAMKADQGVLVTSNASQAFLAPESRAVAYITDGTLFVRLLKEK